MIMAKTFIFNFKIKYGKSSSIEYLSTVQGRFCHLVSF
jgi:hypothetical protein